MAAYSLIAAIVIRLLMALVPHVGLLRRDTKHFALGGAELQEALELMDVVNSRLILLSWPLFAIVTIATRAGELNRNFTGAGVPILFALLLVVCVACVLLPTRLFRGLIPPFLVLAIVSFLDAGLYFWLMDPIVRLLTV